jgi:hypothetical protein
MKNLLLFTILIVFTQNLFSQNVGIGTENPTKGKLVVRGTVGAVSAMFGDNTSGVSIENNHPGIAFNSYFNGSRKAIGNGFGAVVGLDPNNGDFNILATNESSNADAFMNMQYRLHINKDGNLGIQGAGVAPMPLTFNNILGNKIALWGQSTTAHYGLGVQASKLQIYTPTASDDITFGTGSSTSFTENMRITGDGKVGIGEDAPDYKLDVNGRMRIKHNGNTAGIYFDGTTLPIRSFIGTLDEDHVGIYGSGGANWNFAMNVNNGNTGIGTQAPSARLDVNGNVRIRGSIPKKGSLLTSNDTNGNAEWKEAVAFKASGRNTTTLDNFPLDTWTQFFFETTTEYNLGFAYSASASQLNVVEDGIYHFNSQIQMSGYGDYMGIRLQRNRGGTITTIGENIKYYNLENPPTLTDVVFVDAVAINTDVKLLAGDIVYVEFIFNTSYSNNPFPISSSNDRTFFNGHLIARL